MDYFFVWHSFRFPFCTYSFSKNKEIVVSFSLSLLFLIVRQQWKQVETCKTDSSQYYLVWDENLQAFKLDRPQMKLFLFYKKELTLSVIELAIVLLHAGQDGQAVHRGAGDTGGYTVLQR